MLTIKTLETTGLSDITHAFNAAFSDYFVPFQVDQYYLYNRWKAARVDYKRSVGAFDGELLVGFLIFGIDTLGEVLTAHNAATGVIPGYRGQRLVTAMYQTAFPLLKAAGVKQSTLEVITQNQKAIKAYRASGYTVRRTLLCFSGLICVSGEVSQDLYLRENIPLVAPPGFSVYPQTWELSDRALQISASDYACCCIEKNGELKAYVIFNRGNGFIARLGVAGNDLQRYAPSLFAGLAEEVPFVKINNVDEKDRELVSFLLQIGLENPINQYEMYMDLQDCQKI